jgi:superfamily II DNA helicase RecQ
MIKENFGLRNSEVNQRAGNMCHFIWQGTLWQIVTPGGGKSICFSIPAFAIKRQQ